MQLPLFTPRVLWQLVIGSNCIRVCQDEDGQVILFSWPKEWGF